jgi:hypothetical protein
MFSRTASRKFSRPYATLAVAACAMAAVAATPAAATAAPSGASPKIPVSPIGPNQYFSGYINGSPPGQAIIRTNCFGAIQPGQTGNPLPNQTVEVRLASPGGAAGDLGYTGSAANSIVATLGPSQTALSVIGNFTVYNTIEYIPTTITVPCAGSGVATFAPSPGSSTASPATLNVTFEGQP